MSDAPPPRQNARSTVLSRTKTRVMLGADPCAFMSATAIAIRGNYEEL